MIYNLLSCTLIMNSEYNHILGLATQSVNENVHGILEAWYPGQAGGTAIAEVLFGEYNPAGRLPVTFELEPKNLAFVNEEGTWTVEPGSFLLSVGGRQPGEQEIRPGNYTDVLVGEMEVTGSNLTLE